MDVLNVLGSAAYVTQPVRLVRDLLLDDLPRLATLLPNVERIEPLTSQWAFGTLERRDRWYGRTTSKVIQALVPSGLVAWTIRSTWHLEPFAIAWHLEPLNRPFTIEGSGRIDFHPEAERLTRVAIDGTLTLGKPDRGVLASFGEKHATRLFSELLRTNLSALFEHADLLVAGSVGSPAARSRAAIVGAKPLGLPRLRGEGNGGSPS